MHGDQVHTGLTNSLQICTSAMVEVPDSAKSSTGGLILGTLREVGKNKEKWQVFRYILYPNVCWKIYFFLRIYLSGFRQEEVKKRNNLTFGFLMP